MKRFHNAAAILIPAAGALFLILDSRCAAESMTRGLELCLRTVVPSLFPLFVLSGILVPQLAAIPFPRKVGRFLGIPQGAEGIFLLGAVGGFPLGAQCITRAVESQQLSRKDGERMLGFCDNCGAAFLFGILPALFKNPLIPLACFLIQLESAILVAASCSGDGPASGQFSAQQVSLSASVQRAIRSMATVCAWIMLCCVGTGFLQKWLFPFLTPYVRILCTGLLELTAGCMAMGTITDESLRLIFCCGFVCFGGISVLLQIHAVAAAQHLSMAQCIRQKLLQAFFGVCLAAGIVQWGGAFLVFPIPLCYFLKKEWNYLRTCGIIPSKREVSDHAVS